MRRRTPIMSDIFRRHSPPRRAPWVRASVASLCSHPLTLNMTDNKFGAGGIISSSGFHRLLTQFLLQDDIMFVVARIWGRGRNLGATVKM